MINLLAAGEGSVQAVHIFAPRFPWEYGGEDEGRLYGFAASLSPLKAE